MSEKYMKRIKQFLILSALVTCVMLYGCSDVQALQPSSTTYMDPALMHPNLVQIYEKGTLWYDSTTQNVYFWNDRGIRGLGTNSFDSQCATMPTPYLDRTGKIYKYDVEANKLVPFDVYMKDH